MVRALSSSSAQPLGLRAFLGNACGPAVGAWGPPSNSEGTSSSLDEHRATAKHCVVFFVATVAIDDVRSRWGYERSSGTLIDLLWGRGAHPATAREGSGSSTHPLLTDPHEPRLSPPTHLLISADRWSRATTRLHLIC